LFKTHFLLSTKFGEHKKLGDTGPECPLWLRAWCIQRYIELFLNNQPHRKCISRCPVVLVFRARTISRTRHPSTPLYTQRISEERSSPSRTSRVHCSQALRDSRPSHNRCRPNQDGSRIARWRCCTCLHEIGSRQKRKLCHKLYQGMRLGYRF